MRSELHCNSENTTCEKEHMYSGIFTLNSYVMKPVLQTLTYFNLHSKEIDVNTSAELEVNRRRIGVKHSQLRF